MAIVKLKSKDQKISELLRFTSAICRFTKGYQKVPELTGGSAPAPLSPEAYRLKAVNELLRWTIASSQISQKKKAKQKRKLLPYISGLF